MDDEEQGPEVVLEDEIADQIHALKWMARIQENLLMEILRSGQRGEDPVNDAGLYAATMMGNLRLEYVNIQQQAKKKAEEKGDVVSIGRKKTP